MSLFFKKLALITALTLSFPATADESHSFFEPIPRELASPWTTKARPWLIGGVALTATLLVFEDQIIDPTQVETVEHKPLGKWSKLGDYGGRMYPNALYAGGMLLAYWQSENKKNLRHARVMTRASLYAVATSTLIKYTVREERPHKGGDDLSFPSGHTTSAFAFSSVIIAEHGLFPYGIIALGLSTFTAYSRINDNQHFLHDVVAGATIGTAYGLGVSYLGSKEEKKASTSSWWILPRADETPGLTALYFF